MLRALYSSATGMKAQEYVIDVTANNLANVNTNGFKKSMVDFADLMYVTGKQAGVDNTAGQQTPIPFQIGSGVRAVGTNKSFRAGTFEQTTNPFDTAIEGDGFYKIQLPSGEARYTRDGSFKLNSQGQIVNSDGYLLEGSITIPPDMEAAEVSIGVDGTVSGTLPGSTASQIFGTIPLVRFINPAGLSSEGGNLYAATSASGNEIQGTAGTNGFGSIRQGFVERSNVEVVTELISLISAQRAYEINSRAVRAGDEMLSVTADIVR